MAGVPTCGLAVGYTYNINGGAYGASTTFGGLAAGLYTVTAKDGAGCVSAGLSVTITEPAAVAVTLASQVNETCNGQGSGSLTVNPATFCKGSGYPRNLHACPSRRSSDFGGLAAGL